MKTRRWPLAVLQVILGAVFLFSGLVKAVDPLGTSYKIGDYLTSFGMDFLNVGDLTLWISGLLAATEFILGFGLLVGLYQRKAVFGVLLFMLFFTPLTLLVAITNPIADCGCFGDALVLTNWQTFWKDVILLLLALWAFCDRHRLYRLLPMRMVWLTALYGLVFVFGLEIYCLRNLPVLDFRPYRVGVNIPQASRIPDDAEPSLWDTRFVMEKDGRRQTFRLDEYPDSTWTYVSTETRLIKKGFEPEIHDFDLTDPETLQDRTREIVERPGYVFLLVVHRVEEAREDVSDLVNELYDYALMNGYGFYALTSSTQEQIASWKDDTGAEYPFLLADDITLKTVIRDNPGVVLLKDGTILRKFSSLQIPDEYQLTESLDRLELGRLAQVSPSRRVLALLATLLGPVALIMAGDWILGKRRKREHCMTFL